MNPNDLKRVQQTLQRLAFIVEQLNEGVAFTDLNGTIHFANPAIARMHGCGSCRDLLGKSITHLYSEDQIQTVLKSMIDTVRNRGTVQEAVTQTRKDGSTFPAQTKMVLLNDNQNCAVGLILLVTDLITRTQQQPLTRQIEQFEFTNKQLKQQVQELKLVLNHDSQDPVPFDPNEYFGSPLPIRRLLATAKRRPCQSQRSDAIDAADELNLNQDHLSELSEIAKLLKM